MIIIIINIKTASVGYVFFVVVKIHYDLQVRREN